MNLYYQKNRELILAQKIQYQKDNILKSDNKTLEGEQLCLRLLNRKWM